jgi:SAM-dependent methyltransferase
VIDCALCGAASSAPVYRLHGYQIRACDGCGFLFNADFQGGGEAAGTFSRDYFLVHHRAGFEPQLADFRNDLSLPVYERRLDALEARLGRGRLLDVGPGFGSFLRLARDRGWQVEGVEVSAFAAAHIRAAHGIAVFHGDLAGFDATPGSFDLVTFWDSLEHVRHPRQDLETAFRLLRPGGLALLTTDNFDCLIADVASAAYHLSRGRIVYPTERIFIDRNFSYFTERSLRRLLADLGFREVLVEKMEYPLGKIETSVLERWALRAFYLLAAATGRQAQITVVLEKP